ncbi:hypothetical protein GBAR_LOCUS12994, partial [Geodia barretti]
MFFGLCVLQQSPRMAGVQWSGCLQSADYETIGISNHAGLSVAFYHLVCHLTLCLYVTSVFMGFYLHWSPSNAP